MYVDLWANKEVDPGDLIVGAVRERLAKHEGVVKRFCKNADIDKVSVAGVLFH